MSTTVESGSYGGYPVFLRDNTRRPTVRSLALSEIFYPLEDKAGQSVSSRSRSACPPVAGDRKSCLVFSNEDFPPPFAPPVRSASHLSSTKPHRSKSKKSSDASSDSSLLQKLQALFHINSSSGKQKTKKTSLAAAAQKPPKVPVVCRSPPHIPPPLINVGSAAQLRSRSQSAFRSQRTAKTQSDVFVPSTASSSALYLVPVCCASSSLNDSGVSSFTPARPSNLELNTAQRRRNPYPSGPMVINSRTAAQQKADIRQKHNSAHLHGEALQLPSRISCGLWNASSAASLGTSMRLQRSYHENIFPLSSLFDEHRRQKPQASDGSSIRDLRSISSSPSYYTYPSSSISNGSPMEQLTTPPTTFTSNATGIENPPPSRQPSGCEYATIDGFFCTPPRCRPGGYQASEDDIDDFDDGQLCEKTPTAHSPRPSRRPFSPTHSSSAPLAPHLRSESTATLTSCDEEEVPPVYAVPTTYTSSTFHKIRSPPTPVVPPRSTKAVPFSLPPPLKPMSHYVEPRALTLDGMNSSQRSRTPGGNLSYSQSPSFNNNNTNGNSDNCHCGNNRPDSRASSVSRRRKTESLFSATGRMTGCGGVSSTSGNNSNWWSDILPYKPETLPDVLVDRLKQRNNLALSRLDVNVAENHSKDGGNLMTRSLYEPRLPFMESDCASVTPAEQKLAPSILERKRSFGVRPVSYHDTCRFIPSTNLPSLDHLLSRSTSRIPSPSGESPPPPASPPSVVSSTFQEFLQPVDSPLLGQYGRLKLLKGAGVINPPIFRS